MNWLIAYNLPMPAGYGGTANSGSLIVYQKAIKRKAYQAVVLLITCSSAGALFISPARAAIFTVSSVGDGSDANLDDAACSDSEGNCTLRAAIEQANVTVAPDKIQFNVVGSGPHSITPGTQLPVITAPVAINGYTQPGATPNKLHNSSNAILQIELNGSNAGGASGLIFANYRQASAVRGLVINRFAGAGILLKNVHNHVITGNFIGTDPTGSTALGNAGPGIGIQVSSNAIVGGPTPATRNLISGNAHGIVLQNSDYHKVQGNYIGIDKTGTAALGNKAAGVWLNNSSHNHVGVSNGVRNVISGNATGVHISGSRALYNWIADSWIGTDGSGSRSLGNSTDGIKIVGANYTEVASNVISGNGMAGVRLQGGTGCSIIHNQIGAQKEGARPLPNSSHGIVVTHGATGNSLGWNTIVFNGGDGICLLSGRLNHIVGNRMFLNAGLGIDLGDDGVTPNDIATPSDSDTGPNDLQNFPVLTSAFANTGTTVRGSLQSEPNTYIQILFYRTTQCDPSGHGEGEQVVGDINVRTDSIGHASFTANLRTAVPAGRFITATAIGIYNTSEFSSCIPVIADTTPPALAVKNPVHDASFISSPLQAVGIASDTQSGVQNVTVELAAFSSAAANAPLEYWFWLSQIWVAGEANGVPGLAKTSDEWRHWRIGLPWLHAGFYGVRATATDGTGNITITPWSRFTVTGSSGSTSGSS